MTLATPPAHPNAAHDRLATAIFLAVALHLLILLGIGFSAATKGHGEGSSLEVIVVHDPVSDPVQNEQADYLAEVNQRGAGTATDVRRAEAPGGGVPAGAEGTASGGGSHQYGNGDDDLVATRSAGKTANSYAIAAGERSPLVMEAPRADDTAFDTGDALALRGHPKNELLVTANTRASRVAVYLDAWRHRIERIGTANYPLDLIRRAHLTGSPVLEVRVSADGRLVDAIVSRSSGHLALDQAALNILRLSAPFEPFPGPLAALHDSLRLTYEWQFSKGELTDSTVRAPTDTQ